MFGSRSNSTAMQVVGLLVAGIAVVGTVFLDWEWGGPIEPIPFAIALVCVVLAVGATLRFR